MSEQESAPGRKNVHIKLPVYRQRFVDARPAGKLLLALVRLCRDSQWLSTWLPALAASVVIAMHGRYPTKKPARHSRRFIYNVHCCLNRVRKDGQGWKRVSQVTVVNKDSGPMPNLKAHLVIRKASSTQAARCDSILWFVTGYHPLHKLYSSTQDHAPFAQSILVQSAARHGSQIQTPVLSLKNNTSCRRNRRPFFHGHETVPGIRFNQYECVEWSSRTSSGRSRSLVTCQHCIPGPSDPVSIRKCC